MSITRYNIIRLTVERPNQILRFQHKIPSYLKHCVGFKTSHVKGVPTDVYIPELGWITASFNNLKDEVIVSPIAAQPFGNPEDPFEYQDLNVDLKNGQLVVGVYVDSNRSNNYYPYTVSLYLKCKDVLTDEVVQSKQSSSKSEEAQVTTCECPNPADETDQDDDENDNPTDQLC